MHSIDQSAAEAVSALTVTLPDGTTIPRLGQGTWHMAEQPQKRNDEIASLQLGIEYGMTLIDTAEMYAGGRSESLLGEAVSGVARDRLFLVSKVYPHNAGKARIFKSCEDSLRRLKTEALDLYLLHWRGSVPLEETVWCMEELIRQGKILRWGVSNFGLGDMEELWGVPGGRGCQTNQVLYHLGSRGVEFDLLPWMAQRKMPLMAYCPLAQAGRLKRDLLSDPAVLKVAQRHGASPAQILLAFTLRSEAIFPVPKAGVPSHVADNAKAAAIRLDADDLAALDSAFPAPRRKVPLDIQ